MSQMTHGFYSALGGHQLHILLLPTERGDKTSPLTVGHSSWLILNPHIEISLTLKTHWAGHLRVNHALGPKDSISVVFLLPLV